MSPNPSKTYFVVAVVILSAVTPLLFISINQLDERVDSGLSSERTVTHIKLQDGEEKDLTDWLSIEAEILVDSVSLNVTDGIDNETVNIDVDVNETVTVSFQSYDIKIKNRGIDEKVSLAVEHPKEKDMVAESKAVDMFPMLLLLTIIILLAMFTVGAVVK